MYWPKVEKEKLIFSDFEVTLNKEVVILKNGIIERELLIRTKDDKEVTVTQLHAVSWPDYKAPEKEGYIMIEILMNYVDKFKAKHSNINLDGDCSSPILVHCR